ncbi:hypothetical protein [Arthrobacter alpinus]|nr:hypothetical protein [Arthrobacter alpinus]
MKTSPRAKQANDFTSSPEHHWPRMKMSIPYLLAGLIVLALGALMILNDIPAPGSFNNETKRIGFQWMPAICGAVTLWFGGFGVLAAWMGARREGSDALDLAFAPDGIIVRSGHEIAWTSIASVTNVKYRYSAKFLPVWKIVGLNRAFDVYLNEPLDIPQLRTKKGRPYVNVTLLRYPAADYELLFERFVYQFNRRGIPVSNEQRQR